MFAAKDKNGQLVYAKLIEDSNKKYYCTDCDEQVKLVITKTKQKYFCHVAEHDNSNNESKIHKQSKLMLKQDFEKLGYNTDTEVYTNKDQRIDLLATKNERQDAVEFQKSPITDELLTQRVFGYEKCGYQNLWFLGMNYFTRKLTWRQLKFLNYNQTWHWYLLFCDAEKQRYLLMYDIEFFGVMNHRQYRIHYFSELRELQQFHPTESEQLLMTTKNYSDSFKRYCYQNRINYLEYENLHFTLPPIMKDNLMWTLMRFQATDNIDELIRIPAQIKIKPQLTETVIAEVRKVLISIER